ncbi:MAG: TIGR03790 family protein [Planctomycetota bacterium]
MQTPRLARLLRTTWTRESPRFALAALLTVALLGGGLASTLSAQLDPWLDPARILVIYNTSWPDGDADGVPDSTEVAQYYALRRGVPAGNLLGLPLTPAGTNYSSAQWPLFLSELRDPLLAWLAANGPDSVDTLLFCYGVPYQVDVPSLGARSVDNALCVPYSLGTVGVPAFQNFKFNNPAREPSPHVPPDIGHFDHALYDFSGQPLYQHCRLDGLSAEHSKALVDRAAYGQRHIRADGYSGFGYVDTRFGHYSDAQLLVGYPFSYSTYELADLSMAYGKYFVQQSPFPLRWEPWETEIGEAGALFSDGFTATYADSALFYGGWYNFAKYQHAWEWKTGAFACDLNSNSAQGLRAAGTVSFLCQAFQENLTAGAGVIAEPYLNGHNRPDVVLAYMLDGFPWAEAAMVSEPAIKWMGLHVGDPLHRFAPAAAVFDFAPPAPWMWLGADHNSLELELPALPVGTPGGLPGEADAEVFRCTAVHAGATPLLFTTPVWQPDDRRLQSVAVPPTGQPGLTWASVTMYDPSGNGSATPVSHFLAGPQPLVSAVVAVDDNALGPADPLVLRCSFGAADGVLSAVTGFSMTLDLPEKGVFGLNVAPLFLPLASGYLFDRDVRQVNFSVVFPPGVWPTGPATLDVSLTAGGQTALGSVSFVVSD